LEATRHHGRFRIGAKAVRIAAAVAVVAAIAALVVPFLIPIDSYRPLLVWAVESPPAATSRSTR